MRKAKSIRVQLLHLIMAMAIPVATLEAYSIYTEYRSAEEQAERSIINLAEATSFTVGRYLREAQSVTTEFAGWLSSQGARNTRFCNALTAENDIIAQFHNLLLVDTSGHVICSGASPSELPEDLQVGHETWFRQALAGAEPVPGVARHDHVTGHWVAMIGAPIRDETGQVAAVLGGAVDLIRLQGFLEELSLPDGAVITLFDTDVNVAARSVDAERWVGSNATNAFLESVEVEPGKRLSRSMGLDTISRIWGTVDLGDIGWKVSAGLTEESVYGPLRATAIRKAGTFMAFLVVVGLLALALYGRIAAALRDLVSRTKAAAQGELIPIPDSSPQEVVEVGMHFNRTLEAVHRAQASERRVRERYQSIMEHAVFGILVSSRDGKILEANPALAAMLGFAEPRQLVGVNATSFFKHSECAAYLLPDVPSEFALTDFETTWVKGDGIHITVRLNGAPIRYDGHEAALEVIVQDVTEQRALEEQYRQAQKLEAVGRLAGGVAHDFNNLLTVIIGQTQMLLEDLDENEPAHASAEDILQATERATALTQQLLAFSRKEVARPRPLDLNQVIENLEKMLLRLLGEDIELVTKLGADLHPVLADDGQIEQVIMNLVINARDAMPEGGRIVVETSNWYADAEEIRSHPSALPGPYVRLQVLDTGHGMDPDVQSRAFEPFFTTKPQGEGTGLGLSTVYGIVTQSSGHIALRSAPGQGTVFDIIFPREHEALSEEPHAASELLAEAGSESILLVEDEEPVRQVVQRVLERVGYRVITASSGAEAMRLMGGFPEEIHLMITDMMMPGIKGSELAEWMAVQRPHTKVMLISGYSDNPIIHEWARNDPNIFLPKPFTPVELLQRVRERLGPIRPGSTPDGTGKPEEAVEPKLAAS